MGVLVEQCGTTFYSTVPDAASKENVSLSECRCGLGDFVRRSHTGVDGVELFDINANSTCEIQYLPIFPTKSFIQHSMHQCVAM
jgi:hypothetical protein